MNRPTSTRSRGDFLRRKEGDSNPRYGNPYGSLANCWFQPLTHPSKKEALNFNRGVISLIAGAKVRSFFETTKFFADFFNSFLIFPFSFLSLSGIRDSNPRPSAWEANALPTELIPLGLWRKERARTHLFWLLRKGRADSRTRTGDPRITNALLYQLSHIGSLLKISCSKAGAKIILFFGTAKYFAIKVSLLSIFL